jgi:hypothetical protein
MRKCCGTCKFYDKKEKRCKLDRGYRTKMNGCPKYIQVPEKEASK